MRLALISLAAACVATFCASVLAAWVVLSLSPDDETGMIQAVLRAFLLLPAIAMFSISAALDVMPIVAPAAALVGAVLWDLGGRHAFARMRRVWAAIGALFALAVFAAMAVGIVPDVTGMLQESERARLAVSFVLAGAGAALVFRAGFRFLALFLLSDEDEQEG